MTRPFKTVAVCGPTASGKSALSLYLAQALNAEVVNVDSVQVYRELDIGSAKLKLEEREGVPHHVLDVFSPADAANVAEFRRSALGAVGEIAARGKLPLLVGGSGMYFTVLLHGLAEVSPTPDEVRRTVAAMSPEAIYAELSAQDPETAERLNPNDLQRVSRAVEILRVTGKRPSELFAQHTFTPIDVVSLVVVLCRPRDELYRRINLRSEKMVSEGLVAETERLLSKYGEIPALETLGYKQARDLIAGRLSPDCLAREIALYTRRFAKRQMTYWRNEPKKRGWLTRPHADELGEEVAGFEDFPASARQHMKSFRAFHFSPIRLVKALQARLREPLERTEVWYVIVDDV